jgi:hypothetical protein
MQGALLEFAMACCTEQEPRDLAELIGDAKTSIGKPQLRNPCNCNGRSFSRLSIIQTTSHRSSRFRNWHNFLICFIFNHLLDCISICWLHGNVGLKLDRPPSRLQLHDQYWICGLILPISSLGSPGTDWTTTVNKCSDITSIFAIALSLEQCGKSPSADPAKYTSWRSVTAGWVVFPANHRAQNPLHP